MSTFLIICSAIAAFYVFPMLLARELNKLLYENTDNDMIGWVFWIVPILNIIACFSILIVIISNSGPVVKWSWWLKFKGSQWQKK